MTPTTTALADLAALLRSEAVISPHVRDPESEPLLGELAAAGPRAQDARAEYTLLVEAIREGYLLHYEEPRLIQGADADLRLLAGDYLYALGLERLAARGDLAAVTELADLISLAARIHAGEVADDPARTLAALWLATTTAIGAGSSEDLEQGKAAVRRGDPEAAGLLARSAAETAAAAGIGEPLARAADSVGFAAEHLFDRG